MEGHLSKRPRRLTSHEGYVRRQATRAAPYPLFCTKPPDPRGFRALWGAGGWVRGVVGRDSGRAATECGLGLGSEGGVEWRRAPGDGRAPIPGHVWVSSLVCLRSARFEWRQAPRVTLFRSHRNNVRFDGSGRLLAARLELFHGQSPRLADRSVTEGVRALIPSLLIACWWPSAAPPRPRSRPGSALPSIPWC